MSHALRRTAHVHKSENVPEHCFILNLQSVYSFCYNRWNATRETGSAALRDNCRFQVMVRSIAQGIIANRISG